MKNKYFTFVALAAAALATSCASDDLAEQKQEQNQNGTRTVTLTASVNDVQTRVGMTKGENSTASFYWHEKDAISVLTTSDNNTYSNTQFTTTVKTGKASATFTGTVASGSEVGTYAVYPYSASHKFTSATALTYNLPASYTEYKPESNIFPITTTTEGSSTTSTSYPSNPTNMPMLGTIDNGKITFKCLSGLAVIRIEKMPAAEGTLTVTADQQLSGSFTVSNLAANEAKIETPTTTTTTNNSVKFEFSGVTANNIGIFYLPLATGSYTNVKVTIAYGDNNATTQTVNYGSLTISRAVVTAIPLYANGTSGALTKFSSISGNVYTLNGHEFVDLGGDILWAKVNIGATSETESGTYYTWKDAQSHIWAACRLPTIAEIEALLPKKGNYTWTWTTESSVKGYKVTQKDSGDNGSSIFFPAAGYINGNSSIASPSYYWSSTPNPDEKTANSYGALNFSSDGTGTPSFIYPNGANQYPVRLVTEKP